MDTKNIFPTSRISLIGIMFFLSLIASVAFAGDDPSIKGSLRENIKTSMDSFIKVYTVNGTYYIYDAVQGRLLRLNFKKLHDGIVKKGDFYVSCADFVDEHGKMVDLDFLVIPNGEELVTTQGVVHAIDGKKRKYHLE